MSEAAPQTQTQATPTTSAEEGRHQSGRLESVFLRFGTIGELMVMLARGGRWWMLPMVSVFVVIGLALVFLQSVQYVAPFIYMVF